MTITLNTETIRLLTLFENMTNAPVRDCFIDDNIVYFIVEEGKIGLAIGKNGNSIKNVEKVVGKRVKVFEYSKKPEKFVKNLIPQCKEINLIDDKGTIKVEIKVNRTDKGFVIGRGGEKIKIYKAILKRIHNVSNIQVK